MQHCLLGKTGIKVSKIGFGTGTSGFTGVNLHTQMSVDELSGLLIYGYELGINLWDTAYSYGTYPHIKEALKSLNRENIVISSKTALTGYEETLKEVEDSLKILGTDYIDVFLLHGVRNAFDFWVRRCALRALTKSKEKGDIRAVGFSCHGIGAIEKALHMPELDIIMARLNFSGDYMDSYQENLLSNIMSIPVAKNTVRFLIPKQLLPSVSKLVEPPKPSLSLQEKTRDLLNVMHEAGKGVMGIKLFGAGKLKGETQKVISFAKPISFVNSFVIGMTHKEEIRQNVSEFLKPSHLHFVCDNA